MLLLFKSLLPRLSTFLLVGSLLPVVHGKGIPLPAEAACSTQPGTNTLFCAAGQSSIPHRYIIKFHPDATSSEILTHLKTTNATFLGSDCSFNSGVGAGMGTAAGGLVPGAALSSPQDREARGVTQCQDPACEVGKHSWHETGGSRDLGRCGFSYIYDSVVGGTRFCGYAVAMSEEALAVVLADPIVLP